MIRISYIVSLTVFILSQSVLSQLQPGKIFNRGDVCVLLDNTQGICESARSCSWAKEQILSKKMSLHQIVTCGFEKDELLICCKQKSRSKKLLTLQRKSEVACDLINKQRMKIENESTYSNVNLPVQPTEFPHMVALGFYNDIEQQYKYICSGTLITRSIVLTSARCVDGPPFPTIVTLGKVTLEQTFKLLGENQRHIGIENTTIHPDYTFGMSYHDIALVKLLMPVTISSAIQPACLASINSNLMKSTDNQLFSAGWGQFLYKNRNMTVLHKQGMEIVGRESCDFDYKVANFSEVSEGVQTGQFCAFVDKSVKETEICRIEAPGGPIETNVNGVHYVAGVSSFRPFCGRLLPEIFISLGEYFDWIESIVWPQDVTI